MLKITKFGGSSVADSGQFWKVKNIVLSDKSRKYVVVSAPGRRNKQDSKITDLLYLLDAHRTYHVDGRAVFELIKQRYVDIKNELGLKQDVESELEEFYANIDDMSQADIVSRGEYFCAKLMAEYLGYQFIDAKDNMIFNADKTVNMEATTERLQALCASYDRFVFPGFYGSTINHQVMVFPRGGGDITGSILASALQADMYENWTDVSGFLMADPHIVENPKQIASITYGELRELSLMGASVLHDEAVFPVKESNIPIHILNTNRPDDPGTIIQENVNGTSPYDITGIAGKKGYIAYNIYNKNMSGEIGYVRKILSIFEHYGVSIQHLPSGIDSFSVIVEKKDIEKCEYELLAKIKNDMNPDEINVKDNLALISTVGKNMTARPGTCGKLFGALGANNINIAMISQGADEMNITVGVDKADFEKTIRVIYNTFVKE